MKKFKLQIAAGVILIMSGTLVFLNDYIKEKRDVVFSEMNLVLSSINTDSVDAPPTEEVINEEEVQETPTNEEVNYESYLGIIDISKIGLYKGFYDKESSLNNVKFNLYVLPVSDYPDVKNGNLVVAGHSGNYNNSYFANLYKLDVNDEVTIHYNNKDYIYKIDNIYNEEKTGTVRIYRKRNETTLTLITCTKDDDYHQTIYIAYLINK